MGSGQAVFKMFHRQVINTFRQRNVADLFGQLAGIINIELDKLLKGWRLQGIDADVDEQRTTEGRVLSALDSFRSGGYRRPGFGVNDFDSLQLVLVLEVVGTAKKPDGIRFVGNSVDQSVIVFAKRDALTAWCPAFFRDHIPKEVIERSRVFSGA